MIASDAVGDEERLVGVLAVLGPERHEEAAAALVAGIAGLRDLVASIERERDDLARRLPAEARAYWDAADAAALAPFLG